jgi:RND family efflux transporter MFP subunit
MKTIFKKTASNLFPAPLLMLLLFALVLNLSSCVSPPELEKKKAELAEAKQKLIELTDKVHKLESEIASKDPAKANEMKTLVVATIQIAPSEMNHYVQMQGTIDAVNNVQVNAKMGGVVTKVYVREGQSVKPGQVLAETDASTMYAGLDEAKTQLDLATTVYEKQARLWEQKIGSEIQYINAKSNKEAVENRIKTLKSQIALTRITSPIAGVVDQVNVKEGEMAAPGYGVFKVVNSSDLKATAKVADSYLEMIDEGKSLEVYLPDLNQRFQSNISFVSRNVDPVTRTFGIEAKIPGSPKIRPNMIAVLNINDLTLKNVIVIDENLIQNTEKGKMLFVKGTKDGKLIGVERIVETGLSYGGKVEIKKGLLSGDELITAGGEDLVNGQPITIENNASKK